MPRPRSGVALLAFAFLVAALLGTWGFQQSWQSATARRWIREAQLDSALLVQAESCLDFGDGYIRAVGNDGLEDPAELGRALRSLALGAEVELDFEPPYLLNHFPGITVAVESSRVRAVLLEDPEADPPKSPDAPEPDCEAYAKSLAAFRERLVLPTCAASLEAGMEPAARATLPPPRRVLGVLELEVVSRADGLGLVRRMRGRSRRAFHLAIPACPEALGPGLGMRFASLLELNPVELARSFESMDKPEAAE